MIGAGKLVSGPAGEPILMDEIKDHLRIDQDIDDGDADLAVQLTAAREWFEGQTGFFMLTQQRSLYLEHFPCGPIELPWRPLVSVEYIKYYDVDRVQQTWSGLLYEADFAGLVPRIRPVYGETYPVTGFRLQPVEVCVNVGHALRQAIPKTAIHAIKLLVGHWHENREAVVIGAGLTPQELPFTLQTLVGRHRVPFA